MRLEWTGLCFQLVRIERKLCSCSHTKNKEVEYYQCLRSIVLYLIAFYMCMMSSSIGLKNYNCVWLGSAFNPYSYVILCVLILQLVQLLLRHGANPLQVNSKGQSALDVAANSEVVKLLKHEIIASSSSCSSIDDNRSPTSSDSSDSEKEEEHKVDQGMFEHKNI